MALRQARALAVVVHQIGCVIQAGIRKLVMHGLADGDLEKCALRRMEQAEEVAQFVGQEASVGTLPLFERGEGDEHPCRRPVAQRMAGGTC